MRDKGKKMPLGDSIGWRLPSSFCSQNIPEQQKIEKKPHSLAFYSPTDNTFLRRRIRMKASNRSQIDWLEKKKARRLVRSSMCVCV